MVGSAATAGQRNGIWDVAVVGGGIVGLATAHQITEQRPGARVVVLEKEAEVARHQTGNNSGVVHAGIYYRPGTLRAKLCVEGVERLRAFCEEHGVLYDRCGKVIVATKDEEVPRLEALLERGTQNGVPGLRMLDASEVREIEPHVRAVRGIHSPNTAIVDYPGVSRKLAELVAASGGRVALNSPVSEVGFDGEGVRLRTPSGEVRARYLVACAGLHADRFARLAGVTPEVQIVPFRGEYYMLKPEARHLVRGLIYPVPDPTLPFLGVHLTKTVHGEVEAGPNAVLAFAREGYTYGRIRPDELLESLRYPGFLRLAGRFWKTGAFEIYRSLSKGAFVRSLQELVPELRAEHVERGGAGVRAQALDRQGQLVDDFVIQQDERALHVLNAPSPAATAAISIGAYLAERVPAL